MLDAKQIAAAAYTASSEETTKSFDRLSHVTDNVAKMRLEFFDRIALLDGGTIALSVTLLGFLASKNPHATPRWVTLVVLSWVAFVLSMLMALARNWVEHDRLSKAEYTNNVVAVSQSFEALINLAATVSTSSDEIKQASSILGEGAALLKTQIEQHKNLLWWTKLTGFASLVAMVVGFVLLLIFAAENVF